jgi:hypothetical protein
MTTDVCGRCSAPCIGVPGLPCEEQRRSNRRPLRPRSHYAGSSVRRAALARRWGSRGEVSANRPYYGLHLPDGQKLPAEALQYKIATARNLMGLRPGNWFGISGLKRRIFQPGELWRCNIFVSFVSTPSASLAKFKQAGALTWTLPCGSTCWRCLPSSPLLAQFCWVRSRFVSPTPVSSGDPSQARSVSRHRSGQPLRCLPFLVLFRLSAIPPPSARPPDH